MPAIVATGDVEFPVSVEFLNGVYSLVLGPGLAVPFFQFGQPLASVGAGWQFHALHTMFAPLLLMELENAQGQRATWFFDSTPSYVANTIAGLDPFFRSMLVRRMAEVAEAVLSTRPSAEADRLADAFFRIEPGTRITIALAYAAEYCPPPRVVPSASLAGPLPILPKEPMAKPGAIGPDWLRSAVRVDFQDRLMKAARDGELKWPSPLDGTPLPCLACLCLTDFVFVYRFEEPVHSLPFYVVTGMHKASCLAVFLPSENMLVVPDDTAYAALSRIMPDIGASMAHFVAEHGDAFRPYLRRTGPKTMAASMRELHLGHLVWNELSGLERLAVALPAVHLPPLLPFGGTAIEVFGPLEKLFPEFHGKVRPDLKPARNFVEFAYGHNLMPARFTDEYMPAGLRDRIVRTVRKTDEYWAAMDRCKGRTGPTILIGLRVENRTAADLFGFVVGLVRCLSTVLPGVLIVLDGQNGGPSFGAERAARSPGEVELELCHRVQAAFDPRETAIEIASGKTVATSIAWSHIADAFIAFWGAGLAKYRWIANKPGLVISNHDNLVNRPDLHIYDDPLYMADPAPLTFVDPSIVTDDPGAVQLIALPDPSFANFHVNEPAFLDQVRAFCAPWAKNDASVAVAGDVA